MQVLSYLSQEGMSGSYPTNSAWRFMPSERDVLKKPNTPTVQRNEMVGPGDHCVIHRRKLIDYRNVSHTTELALYGLIPSWACDAHSATQNCVTHIATVANKPAYRSALNKAQFCWISVDYFLGSVWKDGREQPVRIEQLDQTPLYLAGIWSEWTLDSGAPILSFCLLTRDTETQLKAQGVRLGQGMSQSYVILSHSSHRKDWLCNSFEQNSVILETIHTPELLISPYTSIERPRHAT